MVQDQFIPFIEKLQDMIEGAMSGLFRGVEDMDLTDNILQGYVGDISCFHGAVLGDLMGGLFSKQLDKPTSAMMHSLGLPDD